MIGRSAPQVKVCCIASLAEAATAITMGSSALGLVSAMPSGPGPISEALIAEIAASVPPSIATFLLTAFTDTEAIIEQHRRCRTTTLQLVDRLTHGNYQHLHHALPGIGIVQVVHVLGEESYLEALTIAAHVDAILLDSGNPGLVVKELGGTGRRHDWDISRRIVNDCGKPVYLAGGLNSTNVHEAIIRVRPFGLDLCSGVRTEGALDALKLRAFFDSVAAAGYK